MSYRLRFAPSPTGKLHIGNLEILLLNNIYKNLFNGELILRVDFTHDLVTKEIIDNFIKNDIKAITDYFDIEFDSVVIQEDNRSVYKKYFDTLLSRGLLVERMSIYYVNFNLVDIPDYICYTDEIFGTVTRRRKLLRNIAIYDIKKDRYFYNFSSVVDDIECNVNYIVRGSDHIDNSIVQYTLYKVLGNSSFPKVASVPLCRVKDSKLSKRYSSEYTIENFMKKKILPETFISYFFYNSSKAIGEPKISKNYKDFSIEKIVALNSKILRSYSLSLLKRRLQFFGYCNLSEKDWNIVRQNIASIDDIDAVLNKIKIVKYNRSSAFFNKDNIDNFKKMYGFKLVSSDYISNLRNNIFLGLQGGIMELIDYFLS